MKRFRRLLFDRVNGGLLAAMLIHALVFQAVVVGSARAGMLDDLLTGADTHCLTSPSPADPDAARGLDGCCSIACQTACATFVGLPDTSVGCDAFFGAPASSELPVVWSISRSPRHLGCRQEARAPPYFSA